MWTVDARCSQCEKKTTCTDRTSILSNLSTLTGQLNAADVAETTPGDGILIVACKDFAVA